MERLTFDASILDQPTGRNFAAIPDWDAFGCSNLNVFFGIQINVLKEATARCDFCWIWQLAFAYGAYGLANRFWRILSNAVIVDVFL